MTASIDEPDSGADGVIAVQGGGFGGWSLYAKEGRLKYCYNFIGLELADVEDAQPLSAGPHEVRLEFAYDGVDWARVPT